jgi:hypothetical protein
VEKGRKEGDVEGEGGSGSDWLGVRVTVVQTTFGVYGKGPQCAIALVILNPHSTALSPNQAKQPTPLHRE